MNTSSLKYPKSPVWAFPKVESLPAFFRALECLSDSKCFICLEVPVDELIFTPSFKLIVASNVPVAKKHTNWLETSLLPIAINRISIETLVFIAKDILSRHSIYHITVYNSELEVLINAPDYFSIPYHVSSTAPEALIRGITEISQSKPELLHGVYSSCQ